MNWGIWANTFFLELWGDFQICQTIEGIASQREGGNLLTIVVDGSRTGSNRNLDVGIQILKLAQAACVRHV